MHNKAIVGKLPVIPAGSVRRDNLNREKRIAASTSSKAAFPINDRFRFGAGRGNQSAGAGFGEKAGSAAQVRRQRSA